MPLPALARDAGTVVLDGSSAIGLDGQLSGRAAQDGRGARVDIVSDRITIVPQETDGIAGVQLLDSDLDSLDATSILIGGRRNSSGAVTDIDVRAANVTVASGAELRAPEILLAARGGTDAEGAAVGGVTLQSGAVVSAEGAYSGMPRDLVIGDATGAAGNGDGVLIRASTGDQVGLTRYGTTGSRGVLNVQAGASVAAAKSMILDASARTAVSGSVGIAGGSLMLGAERISLGNVPEGTPGLSVLTDQLAALSPAELVLSSRSTVDLYGDVSLGTDASGKVLLDSLIIDAAGIEGYGGSGTSRFTAGRISLSNPGNAAAFMAPGLASLPAKGTGTLQLETSQSALADASGPANGTGTLVLGEGLFQVDGFSALRLRAERGLVGAGSGTFSTPVDTQIETPRVSVASGASAALEIGGTLDVAAGPAPVATNVLPDAGLGGTLSVTADAMTLASGIELPSGQVSLATRGDLSLASGASIDVAGRVRNLGQTQVGSWGGSVHLTSREGNLVLAPGASVNLSGAAPDSDSAGADAGLLSLSALGLAGGNGGSLNLQGQLIARAQDGYRQGRFSLDAVRLAGTDGFAAMNAVLDTGSFGESRSFRLRQGDVAVGADSRLVADDISLTVDAGSIDVQGTLDADGASGGAVALAAGGDVTLHGASAVTARATVANGSGGSVSVSSSGGRIDLEAGSTIDSGADGQVSLRARRARLAQATGADGQPLFDAQGRPVAAVDSAGRPIFLYSGADGEVLATGPSGGQTPLDAAGRPVVDSGTDDIVAVTGLDGTVTAGRVAIEAFRSYQATDGQLTAADTSADASNPLFADASAFTDQAPAIMSSLGVAADPAYRLLPGVEVVADGNMTLGSDWNLLDWRFGPEAAPGVLTLRAGGDLLLAHSLSDAFSTTTTAGLLQTGDSWGYRLVGGADLSGADPEALRALPAVGTAGNVVVASGQRVRTGNGDIALAAARDFQLADQTSTVYTAGVPVRPPESIAGTVAFTENWSSDGGDISISAQHDVLGAKSTQLVSSWLWRQGRPKAPLVPDTSTQWAVDFGRFQENVGALGGGDVSVAAGRNVVELSAMIPTTGRQATPGADRSVIDTWGGGNLSVGAGGNVLGGVFMTGAGNGRIEAGGRLTKGVSALNGQPLAAIFVGGDSSFDVRTGGSSEIGTVVQENLIPQPINTLTDFRYRNYFSSFLNFGPDNALRVASAAGDIVLQTQASQAFAANFPDLRSGSATLSLLPPTVEAYALSGSVSVANPVTLLPAPEGTLDLRAAGSLALQTIIVSDADRGLLPSPAAPVADIAAALTHIESDHASPLLHADDPEPVRLIADAGNVQSNGLLEFPKFVDISAGNDVQRLQLSAQNVRDSDVSSIQAGRDIRFTSAVAIRNEKIEVGGPGQLDVAAGRNIDLGASSGITTIGNLKNPLLADTGAGVSVVAGTKGLPGYQSFLDKYFVQTDDHVNEVAVYMRDLLGEPKLGEAAAREAFLALPVEQQRPLVLKVFFDELRAAGRDANAGGDYSGGFDAIATLFPPAAEGQPSPFAGNVSMYQSRIYTLDGGDIDILVPGGYVNEGLASASNSTKAPSDLGIVAQRSGSVRAFTDGDFTVNRSRVFTLAGGDIVMWSSKGNIDAGRGAKTAISAPAPSVTFDSAGNAVVDLSGAVAGSGIRAIITNQSIAPGAVDLIAPVGFVNAGDAGISSAGDLNIAAAAVVGADNIQVGGIATGVPVDTGGLGASLSSVSAVAASGSNAAQQSVSANRQEESATPLADEALGFLQVFVTGFGEENCSPEDSHCQAQQGEQQEQDQHQQDQQQHEQQDLQHEQDPQQPQNCRPDDTECRQRSK